MTDYSKLSDFEINKLVARSVDGIDVNDENTAIDCYLQANDSDCVKWYKVEFCDPFEFELFDPCNNPSDAWPIITENKIAIKPKLITKKEYATPSDYIDGWEAKVHSTWFEDKNPLRAAMIVYLMMQDELKGGSAS